MIIIGAFAEYSRLFIIAQGVRNALQSSVITVATENYNETYNGLREGYSGGYVLDADAWVEIVDTADVYQRLSQTLGTNETDTTYYVKGTADKYEYKYSDLEVVIENIPIQSDSSDNFEADVSIFIEVPISFGFNQIPDMKMTLKTKAKFSPQF